MNLLLSTEMIRFSQTKSEKLALVFLLLTTFFIPWACLIEMPWLNLSPVTLVGRLLLIVWLFKISFTRKLKLPSLSFIFVGLFVVWSTLTLIWSVDQSTSMANLRALIASVIYAYIVWDMVSEERVLSWILLSFVLGSSIASIAVICSYIVNHHSEDGLRYSAFFYNPNDTAFILTIAFPMAWQLLRVVQNKILKIFLLLYLFMAAYAVFLTCSRSAYIAMTMAACFLSVIYYKDLVSHNKILAASSIILIVVIIYFPPGYITAGNILRSSQINITLAKSSSAMSIAPLIHESFLEFRGLSHKSPEKVKNTTQLLNLDHRTQLWESGFSKFLTRPIEGLGFGTFNKVIFYGSSTLGVSAHNAIIQILLEDGLVGIFLLLLIVGSLINLLKQQNYSMRWFSCMTCMIWFIGLMTQNYVTWYETWFLIPYLNLMTIFYNNRNLQNKILSNS